MLSRAANDPEVRKKFFSVVGTVARAGASMGAAAFSMAANEVVANNQNSRENQRN